MTHNTTANTVESPSKIPSILDQHSWPPTPLSALSAVTRASNQVLEKREDGTLHGVRYVVAAEPSTLRPIRSWTINIEKWSCESLATISAEDILFIRILNMSDNDNVEYSRIVKDIIVNGEKLTVDNQSGFNAVMATVLFISKIDAGRLPDIDKTLSIYNFKN
tara:strand:+ start:2142 stop:2630 length:489 start_codon:yes stop_codon:yes gene_type:complete